MSINNLPLADSYFIASHEISMMINNGRSEEGILCNYCMGRVDDYYKFYEHNIIIRAIQNAIMSNNEDVKDCDYVKFTLEDILKSLKQININNRKTSYEEIEKLVNVLASEKILGRLSDALTVTPCLESILLEAKEYEKKKMEENRELLRAQERAKQLLSRKHK